MSLLRETKNQNSFSNFKAQLNFLKNTILLLFLFFLFLLFCLLNFLLTLFLLFSPPLFVLLSQLLLLQLIVLRLLNLDLVLFDEIKAFDDAFLELTQLQKFLKTYFLLKYYFRKSLILIMNEDN